MTPSIAHGNDYAWAGAEVINPIPEPGFSIPNVPQQIALYLNDHGGKADPNALYILEGGGNDIIDANGSGDPQSLGFQIALGLASVELALRHAGAKNFLVPILFDVGLLPAASPNNGFATEASLATNKYLGDLLKLEELLQGIDIRRPDIFSHDAIRRQRPESLRLHRHHPSLPHRQPYAQILTIPSSGTRITLPYSATRSSRSQP